MMAVKLTRQEKRAINYAIVRNITGDVKQARQARDWSLKRIKETYGVTEIPKKVPRLIPIEEVKRSKAKPPITLPKTTESDRKDTWRSWAKGDGDVSKFPFVIRRLVKDINRRQGFDDYAGYGFAVLWHAFVLDNSLTAETLLFYEQNLTPDKHDGDIYLPVMAF
jgi:hypothetical protein